MTRWDEGLDRSNPYEMLSPQGDLCLISDRVLPPPAAPLRPVPGGSPDFKIERAVFHGRLQPPPMDPESKQRFRRVQRSDMAAINIDFTLRSAQPLSAATAGGPVIDSAPARSAMHIGYIQVFMALKGRHHEIKPDQPDERLDTPMAPPIVAWRQTRRLVAPLSFRAERPQSWLLRASTPLQIEGDARLGHYNVWVRLTRSRNDDQTPWTRVDDVILQ